MLKEQYPETFQLLFILDLHISQKDRLFKSCDSALSGRAIHQLLGFHN